MLRFVADENFNGDIVRGLLLRRPDVDLVRVQDAGLTGADDPEILAWATAHDRIVLSHDRADDARSCVRPANLWRGNVGRVPRE